MKTTRVNIDFVDYWFDKTIEMYVSNTRVKIEIDSEFKSFDGSHLFISDMTVLFTDMTNRPVYCKIQSKMTVDFKAGMLSDPMLSESIFLYLRQQFQFTINQFRQEHWGTLILPTNIPTSEFINESIYLALRDQYPFLNEKVPLHTGFNPYW